MVTRFEFQISIEENHVCFEDFSDYSDDYDLLGYRRASGTVITELSLSSINNLSKGSIDLQHSVCTGGSELSHFTLAGVSLVSNV